MKSDLKVFSGNGHPSAGEVHLRIPAPAVGQVAAHAVCRWRGLLPDPGERARYGRVRHPAYVPSGQRTPGRVADRGGRTEAIECRADHRSPSVLRLCTPGPQGQASRPDLGEARGRPAAGGGRRSGAGDGPARAGDPGVLRRSRGSPSGCAGPAGLDRSTAVRQSDDRLARRGRCGTSAVLRQAPRRGPGHHRQATCRGQRRRDDERHR